MYCQFFGSHYYAAIYPGAFLMEAIHFLVDPYYYALSYLMTVEVLIV